MENLEKYPGLVGHYTDTAPFLDTNIQILGNWTFPEGQASHIQKCERALDWKFRKEGQDRVWGVENAN